MPPTRPVEILVVDDEPLLLRMLEIALRVQGCVVRTAGSGSEAIEMYRRHCQSIDVVLLDVQMSGTNGPQTLVTLREMNPEIRAAFMSGNTGSYSEEELRSLGASHFFEKPFRCFAEVANILRQMKTPGLQVA
jgi:CheY-like chemotaxis protein